MDAVERVELKSVDDILRDWESGEMDAAGTIEDLLAIIDTLSLARSNGDEKLVLALKESRSGWLNVAAALRADGRNPEIAETYIEMIDEALLDRLRGSEDV